MRNTVTIEYKANDLNVNFINALNQSEGAMQYAANRDYALKAMAIAIVAWTRDGLLPFAAR